MKGMNEFGALGVVVTEQLIEGDTVAALRTEFAEPIGDESQRRAGSRGLFARSPAVRQLARSPAIRGVVDELLSPDAFAVRAVLFDKHVESNWSVGWHRDATIAVRARSDLPGFAGWSIKGGVPHVRPPAQVLDSMLTVRIHLDDCGPDNGPLLVLPGTHLDPDGARRPSVEPFACEVAAGGAVILRPRLWHSSAKAVSVRRRRVIHFEFTDADLPAPLVFFERIRPT